MANERTYPCLPCADIEEALRFYEALGFHKTYRQTAPNPYAVVAREDMHIHLFGMPNFDPAGSYGNVIVVVPDVDALYHSFAAGLRATYGKLPTSGFPRLLRPRKKYGIATSFSVVDVGGNWLRFSALQPEEAGDEPKGLAKLLEVAARLGDARGDEAAALATLDNGLRKYPEAPLTDYARALLYRAELCIRLGKPEEAGENLHTVLSLPLETGQRANLAGEIAAVEELLAEQNSPATGPDT